MWYVVFQERRILAVILGNFPISTQITYKNKNKVLPRRIIAETVHPLLCSEALKKNKKNKNYRITNLLLQNWSNDTEGEED